MDDARVEELFHEALAMETDRRAEFLERECGGDQQLRNEVEGLLAGAEKARSNSAWDQPALFSEARAAAGVLGGLVGRYELREKIGSGGMGVVYRAVRHDDFSKAVAVKVLQFGMGDRVATARFERERQILAGLEHVNIARLLDGGTTGDGLPFLVMELVDGKPLDRYLAANETGTPEILQLFRKICAAVSCAHRNLVVHRDLKPGNVLVTADGEPKLLDFGVARLLDDGGEQTRTGERALTPRYASPEQVDGATVTTSSDIYSLGVLLYEMLSGRLPYRETSGAVDLAQVILHEAPRPLTEVDDELALIVMMALRKEPERRYASAEQLAEDIRRYTEGYPILARTDTWGYRAKKFAGRNRAMVAAAATVALTLAGGVLATARQARIATRRFNDVRRLAHSYVFEIHDSIQDLPGSTAPRKLIVQRALEYLDRLSREKPSDPELLRELASAYQKISDIQGAPDYPSLGDRAGALENARRAVALREQLVAGGAGAEVKLELATSEVKAARLLTLAGDLKGAEVRLRRAVELSQPGVAGGKTERSARIAVAEARTALGDVLGNPNLPNLGRTQDALESYRLATAEVEAIVAEVPDDVLGLTMLGAALYRTGQMGQALNDSAMAVEAFQKSIDVSERLLRLEPQNVLYTNNLAKSNRSMALAHSQMRGDAQAAMPYSLRSLQLFEEVARADSANVDAQIAVADAYWGHGFVVRRVKGDRTKANSDALRYYDLALAKYAEVKKAHSVVDPALARTAYQLRADALLELDRDEEALRNSEKVLEIDAELLRANPENAGAQRNQGIAWSQIGKVHARRAETAATRAEAAREWNVARGWYQREVAVLEGQEKKGTLIPMYLVRLSDARKAVEKCERAVGGIAAK